MKFKSSSLSIVLAVVFLASTWSDSSLAQTTTKRKRSKRPPAQRIETYESETPTESPDAITSRETVSPPPPAPKVESDRRFYVSAFYSLADEVKYKGKVNLFGVPTDYSATEYSTAAAGVAAGYLLLRPNSFGLGFELSYDLPRNSKGLDGKAGDQTITGRIEGKRQMSVALAALNANFSVGRYGYVFGGVNYPMVLGTDANLEGIFAYQAGLGVNVFDNFSLDVAYRNVAMKGDFKSGAMELKVNSATFSGVVVGLKYFIF